MKRLQIDFAPASVSRVLFRVDGITWVAMCFGLGACIFFGVQVITLMQQRGADRIALQQAATQRQKHLADIPVVQKKSLPAAEISAINAAIAQLNLPWRDLLDAIERATPTAIALLSLEPDAGKHSLKGAAEARDSAAMIAYIASLQQQDFLDEVDLIRHETNDADIHKPLRFQFEAHWRGSPP